LEEIFCGLCGDAARAIGADVERVGAAATVTRMRSRKLSVPAAKTRPVIDPVAVVVDCAEATDTSATAAERERSRERERRGRERRWGMREWVNLPWQINASRCGLVWS
jgi:hypothetical protein